MHGPTLEKTTFIIKPAKPGDSQGGHGPTVTVSHHRTAPQWYQVYCLWQKTPVKKKRGPKPVMGGGSKWSDRRDYRVRIINKWEVDRGEGAGVGAALAEELDVGHTCTDSSFYAQHAVDWKGFTYELWLLTCSTVNCLLEENHTDAFDVYTFVTISFNFFKEKIPVKVIIMSWCSARF